MAAPQRCMTAGSQLAATVRPEGNCVVLPGCVFSRKPCGPSLRCSGGMPGEDGVPGADGDSSDRGVAPAARGVPGADRVRGVAARAPRRKAPTCAPAGDRAAALALEEAGAPRVLVGHQRVEVAVLRRRRARARTSP